MDEQFLCQNCNKMMRKVDSDTYECPKCESRFARDGANGIWEFYDFMEVGDGEDGRPTACTGCGSDMYPDCQYSCSRFDD